MKMYPIIVRSAGLDNTLDPISIEYSVDKGVASLSMAVNVVVTDAGRIERRPGKKLIRAGNYHSLYAGSNVDSFVIMELAGDGNLMRMNSDYSLIGLRDGLTKFKRMDFIRVVNRFYYTNTCENGFVGEDGISHPWPVYIGDDKTTRKFSPAPVGKHLGFFIGRLFVAVGDTLYWSEEFEPGLFDMENNFIKYRSEILMVKSVDEGLFVSDEEDTYFVAGRDPVEFDNKVVLPYPSIEWGDPTNYIKSTSAGFDVNGNTALWVSAKGIVAGLPDGTANLTDDKIDFPDAIQACSVLYNNKLFYTLR